MCVCVYMFTYYYYLVIIYYLLKNIYNRSCKSHVRRIIILYPHRPHVNNSVIRIVIGRRPDAFFVIFYRVKSAITVHNIIHDKNP